MDCNDLRAILKRFLRALLRPAKPGPLYVFSEGQTMSKMKMVVVIPPLGGADDDVTSRTLSLTLDSDLPIVTDVTAATEFRFSAPRGTAVHLELVDLDAAGNKSEPSVADFVVQDTIPPAKPGDLSATVEAQVPDTDPIVYP